MTLSRGFAPGRPLRRRRAATAAVLVTAAVALLGGCGSSGHHAATGPSHGATAAPGTGGASAGTTTGGTGDTPAEAPGSAADAPKLPDAQLTPPGGGTFSEPQKKYLSGRVPKGTDPVAVLEGGQEVCDRLGTAAKTDPDAAAGAIVTGDISRAGATAAVHNLCPALGPVLDAAARGFGDGSFTVAATAAAAVPGRSVAPGTYHAPNPSSACSWRVSGAGGRTLSSGSAGRAADAAVTVPASARSLTSTGCYDWLPGAPHTPSSSSASSSGGTS